MEPKGTKPPRLIDAEALKKRLQKDPLYDLVENYGITGVIDAEPTVEAVPVRHGRWLIYYETEDGRSMRCSQCRMVYWIGNGRDGNYCPNCGAKMTAEEEE